MEGRPHKSQDLICALGLKKVMSQTFQVTYAKFASTRKYESGTESACTHRLSPPPEFCVQLSYLQLPPGFAPILKSWYTVYTDEFFAAVGSSRSKAAKTTAMTTHTKTKNNKMTWFKAPVHTNPGLQKKKCPDSWRHCLKCDMPLCTSVRALTSAPASPSADQQQHDFDFIATQKNTVVTCHLEHGL